jgi:hypothetical protein
MGGPSGTFGGTDDGKASAVPAEDRIDLTHRQFFLPPEGRLLPAVFNAMATACFCGLPAAISVLIFDEMVFRDEPFFSGMVSLHYQ